MKTIIPIMTMLTLFAATTLYGQQPDIIDREIFFGDPEIVGGQISPDGKYISFLKPYLDNRNIWVKGLHEPFEAAKPVTADTNRPIGGYFWSRDGKYILYVQDKGGDENFHVYRVDPTAPAEGDTGVPPVTNLTDIDGVRALLYSVPRSQPDVMYVGLNDRDASYHDLYKVNINTGERELIFENTEKISSWVFDNDDELRLASKTDDRGATEILRVDDDGFTKIYGCDVVENCGVSGFHKDNKKAFLITNAGDLNLAACMLLDPMTGDTELFESDPENEVDFGGLIRSSKTREVEGTVYVGAKQRIYWRDKSLEADYNMLQEKFNGAQIGFGSSDDDERLYLINVSSDTDPGSTYLFDRQTKSVDFVYRPRPDIPVDDLSPMTPITYSSSDGMEIPAYLTLPKGLEAKNLPAVLLVHGGPWARDYWGYNSYAQFLANRGYAVLSMNFRGSTGFGKAFLNAGNGEWGKLMQDDVTWGAKHLIAEGIADAERIAIMGGSYGGYATLAGMTFTPDMYAAGVDIVGPSNLNTLIESIPPYWESFRKIMYARMADPETEDGKAWYHERSPLNHADKIAAPLLVVQGANDPRVKQAEADQIVVAMRELNLPVEYIVAPDEGHGFRRPVNQMAFIAATEKFLASHVGGRYQEDMTDEVSKRLDEITVDIHDVELPVALTADEMKAELPMPVAGATLGKFAYHTEMNIGGQSMEMDQQREVMEADGMVKVMETVTMPMGTMTQTTTMDAKMLTPRSVVFDQGMMNGEMTFADDKISGKINAQGQEIPVDIPVDGQVAPDGSGGDIYLSALDLTPGQTTTLRLLDNQAMKVVYHNMIVGDRESVETPAGTFEALRVDIKPAEGPGSQTIWIDTDKRVVVKREAVLPGMGGAKMISSLKSMEMK